MSKRYERIVVTGDVTIDWLAVPTEAAEGEEVAGAAIATPLRGS